MKLSILLFDGFTTLDVVGGYEVLARIPGVETDFVAERRGIITADTRRLGLVASRSFDDTHATDILYVPGGPGVRAGETDERLLAKIRELDATSTWTVGICNGVGLLAAAGLLRGKRAATNWFYQEHLAAYGAVFTPERYHREGKYLTGAGVSASIDTALVLAKELAGDVVARALQLGIEYYPAPPFPEKTPADVPSELHDIVRAYESSSGAEVAKSEPPFADLIRALR